MTLERKERRVTTMSRLFRRTAIIAVWLVVIGLFAVFGSPMTFTRGVFLLMLGVLPPAIMIILWKAPAPTVAEVLHQVEGSRTGR